MDSKHPTIMCYFGFTFTLFSAKYECESLSCEGREQKEYCKKYFPCDRLQAGKFSLSICLHKYIYSLWSLTLSIGWFSVS